MAGHFERLKRQASFGPVGTPLTILDRYGRQITEGAEILVDHPQAGGVMIQSISPVMDPKAPPGVVRVRAFVHFDFMVKKGEPQLQLLLLRTVEELVAAGVLRPQGPTQVEAPTADEVDEYVNTAGDRIPPPASGSKVEPLIGSIDPGPDPRD